MRTEQIQGLRQTHSTVSTLVPLLTAAVTVTGAVLASMERQAHGRAAAAERDADPREMRREMRYEPGREMVQEMGHQEMGQGARVVPVVTRPVVAREATVTIPAAQFSQLSRQSRAPRRLSPFAFVWTLLSRVLLVVLGVALVLGIVAGYVASDRTWRAIELTALILLVLYLVERVARARRAA